MKTLFKCHNVTRSFVRSFSMGKPGTVEDWELTRVNDEENKRSTPPTEKFSKSFQEYLDTRLTLDEMMKTAAVAKKAKEVLCVPESLSVIHLSTMKLDGRMFYSEEDGRWHKR